jgi:uncharacterized protein YhbP (UPF0306 family)
MEWPAKLLDFIAAENTLTLATNPDGSPHACDLFFVHSGNVFYFLSDPKTRHVKNLTRDPRISATIHGRALTWQDIRGIQMEGTALRVDNHVERAHAFAQYLIKYAFVRDLLPSVELLGQAHRVFGLIELFKVTPLLLNWIENSRSFGNKQMIEVK